jgi:hypothetical protein
MQVPIIAHMPLWLVLVKVQKEQKVTWESDREIRRICSRIENNRPPGVHSVTHHIHTCQNYSSESLIFKSRRIVRPRKERPVLSISPRSGHEN